MNTHENAYIAVGVDIQNDFCPGGTLAVPGGDQVVSPFNEVAASVRVSGGKVVFTRDWHPATTSHFDAWPAHCIAGTDGAAFHPDLYIAPQDTILSKGTFVDEDAYSGFQGRSADGETLEAIVRAELVKSERVFMLIGGLATDYCVKATVLDALELSKKIGQDKLGIIALEHCMKPVNISPTDGKDALHTMRQAGAQFGFAESSLS